MSGNNQGILKLRISGNPENLLLKKQEIFFQSRSLFVGEGCQGKQTGNHRSFFVPL